MINALINAHDNTRLKLIYWLNTVQMFPSGYGIVILKNALELPLSF